MLPFLPPISHGCPFFSGVPSLYQAHLGCGYPVTLHLRIKASPLERCRSGSNGVMKKGLEGGGSGAGERVDEGRKGTRERRKLADVKHYIHLNMKECQLFMSHAMILRS